jgi:hypothetical protein
VKNFSKKEITGLVIATLFVPGGIVGSGIYLWRKYKMGRKDNRNMGISAVDARAAQEVKENPLVRQAYNEMILERLTKIVRENPSQRFGQIMRNYGLVREERPVQAEKAVELGMNWKNEFYLESEALLERVERSIQGKSED